MKYGIYFAYWTHEWFADYKYYMEKAAGLGFDVLEISAAALSNTYTTDAQLYELKDHAKSLGLTLTAGYGPTKEQNLCSQNPAIVASAKSFFRELFPKLQKMGIGLLGGGLYSYWPVDFSQKIDKRADWKLASANIRDIATAAEDCGVVLGMEVLNRFEGYILNTCAEALEFIHDVNRPNVKIMLDTFHMNIEEDNIPAAIRLAGNELVHFHVGEQNRKVPGKGCLPWREIGIALRDIGFDGSVVMEPFVMTGGTIGNDIKVWRELLPDISEAALDRDAKGALQYLRHVFAQ